MSHIRVSGFDPCLWFLNPTSCLCGLWEAEIAQLAQFLPPTWETKIEFLAIVGIWKMNQWVGAYLLSLCLCFSAGATGLTLC